MTLTHETQHCKLLCKTSQFEAADLPEDKKLTEQANSSAKRVSLRRSMCASR